MRRGVNCKISEKDREQVEKLRAAVKDEISEYYDTDFNLLRWLIGHNYNMDVILPKLRSHLRFRSTHWDLDQAWKKPRDHPVHSYWKCGLTGAALRTPNTIVNIEQSGRNDYWGMLATFPIDQMMQARVYDLEIMLKKVMDMESETGEQASVIYIMDLNGIKYDRKLLSLMTGALAGISNFMSENYVEMIHSFVLVNAPSFISAIWSVARPLLPERTRNKVQIFGTGWRNDVLNLAVPEVLPTYWNVDDDEVFKAEVELAERLDPQNYYKGTMLEDAQMLTVAAGKCDFISVNAQKGQSLKWKLFGDGHFAFSVYFAQDPTITDPKSMKNIYPVFSKVPGPMQIPMGDELTCEDTGVYRFWISNQHAWIHSLKLRHHITVE